MPKQQHILHETNGAAFELAEHGTGKVVGVGGRITVPIIYDTVGGPHRAPVTHFLERLNFHGGVWITAKSLRYDLAGALLVVRSTPQFLRVVVIDHAGARHVLGPKATVAKNVKSGDALHVTKTGKVQRATASKVGRTVAHRLVLADLMAVTRKAVRTPKPRRGPAKGRKQAPAPVRVDRESVPLLVPIADVVAEELAHAQFRKVRLGAVGLAMIASLKKQQRSKGVTRVTPR